MRGAFIGLSTSSVKLCRICFPSLSKDGYQFVRLRKGNLHMQASIFRGLAPPAKCSCLSSFVGGSSFSDVPSSLCSGIGGTRLRVEQAAWQSRACARAWMVRVCAGPHFRPLLCPQALRLPFSFPGRSAGSSPPCPRFHCPYLFPNPASLFLK